MQKLNQQISQLIQFIPTIQTPELRKELEIITAKLILGVPLNDTNGQANTQGVKAEEITDTAVQSGESLN